MTEATIEIGGPASPEPPASADLIVVGAGVIGMATAWRAAQAGLEVVVVERELVGAGASPVAAGMLAPAGEAQWGQTPLAHACAVAARDWPAFAAELEAESGVEVGLQACGALHVALDRDEAAALKQRLPLIEAVDGAAEWCLPSRCREIEAGLAPGAGPGVRIPGEGVVDSHDVLSALRAAADARGVTVLEGSEPVELLRANGRVEGIVLASGATVRTAQVVIAAGAWSGTLQWLPDEARPDVRPVKGELVILHSDAQLATGIVHTERVYIVPRASGNIVVGATVEEAGFDVTVSAGGVHELLREAYRVLPDVAECDFVAAAAGLRPATPDGSPYIGETEFPGIHLACGHFRNGVLLAPVSAAAIVAGLTGDAIPAAAQPFAVTGRDLSRVVP